MAQRKKKDIFESENVFRNILSLLKRLQVLILYQIKIHEVLKQVTGRFSETFSKFTTLMKIIIESNR